MSVELNQKLISIQNEQTIPLLKELFLLKKNVFISWWGQKMVSFSGHNPVPINALADKYLQAVPLQHIFSATLEERYDCFCLWKEIALLYEATNHELEKTRVYKYLIPTLECKLYWGCQDVEAIMRGRIASRLDSLLAFPAQMCLKLWPHDSRASDWKRAISEKRRNHTPPTPPMVAQAINLGKKSSAFHK